jgi:hypothetical protein
MAPGVFTPRLGIHTKKRSLSAVAASAPGEKRQRMSCRATCPIRPPAERVRVPSALSVRQDICRTTTPELRETSPGQVAACHFADSLSLAGVQGVH